LNKVDFLYIKSWYIFAGKGEVTLMSNPRISIEIILACYGTISTNRRPKKPKRKTQESAGEITSQQ